jgi:hypothetical protein
LNREKSAMLVPFRVTIFALLLSVCAVLPQPASAADSPEGFQSLFNGGDLSGWSVDGGDATTWGVENGAIVARGRDYRTRNYLLTDREYSDFVLRLEYNLDEGASAGVALRAVPGERMPLAKGGTIFDHPLFKLRNIHEWNEETGTTHWVRGGMYFQPNRSAEVNPAGSWNLLEIEVRGRAMRASVNGKEVLDVRVAPGPGLPDGTVPGLNRVKGRIGLQKHTGTVRFRNIMIVDLGEEPTRPGASIDVARSSPRPKSGTTAARASGTLHVLAIGINDYPDKRLKLDCAAPDARSLRQAFLDHSQRLFRGVEAKLLLDGQATRANILVELQRLASSVQPGDVAVVFYAGHGDYKREGQLYLIPFDADIRDLRQTGISGEALKKAISDLPCTAMLMLDACYAGSFDAVHRKTRALPSGEEVALRDLVYDPGLVVLCGADKEQEASEENGQGFFTKALVEGLSGKADYDGDGVVELDDLKSYVTKRVRALSGGDQEPTLSIPSTVRSFALSRP